MPEAPLDFYQELVRPSHSNNNNFQSLSRHIQKPRQKLFRAASISDCLCTLKFLPPSRFIFSVLGVPAIIKEEERVRDETIRVTHKILRQKYSSTCITRHRRTTIKQINNIKQTRTKFENRANRLNSKLQKPGLSEFRFP